MLMKNDGLSSIQAKSMRSNIFLFLRYLESCNIPVTVKRKYQFSSNTTSSNSDDDKKATEDCVQVPQENPGMYIGTYLMIHFQWLLHSLIYCLYCCNYCVYCSEQ